MYRNDQQLHFVRRPYVHARAVTTSHQDHKVLLMVPASAIVGLWIACLPPLTGSILTRLNVLVQRQTSNETINRLHKGDRFAPVNFHDRWNAIVEIDKAANGTQSVERIPDGCEPAFSHLVKVGNFSARCVANADALTRLTAADPPGQNRTGSKLGWLVMRMVGISTSRLRS
jgi:hypothetical protein